MNPDGTQDNNLRSFYGPIDDGRILNEQNETQGNPSRDYDAPLKFTSGVQNVTGRFGVVYSGRKNGAVDCNNGASRIDLHAQVWDITGSKYGFTNKGGCKDNVFRGTVIGHGRECDFDQDNWSDQSHAPCSGTVLGLIPQDGRPIRVRYIYNKPHTISGTGPYRFVFPWPWLPVPRKWIGAAFNQLRRMGFFR